VRVGVLGLQGDVAEHRRALGDLGVVASSVRTAAELDGVDALILPGGESTTISHLLATSGLTGPLTDRLHGGMPAFGTCAGLVLLSRMITDGRPDQLALGLLDLSVRRTGYGRQIASFESTCELRGVGTVPTVFIRAPRILDVSDDVEVLATIDVGDGAHPVVVRQGAILAASFHPELTDDRSLHALFLDVVASRTVSSPK
jgi:pyridoxal 5'-phosphate synthase pdxT subunit